MSKLGLIIKREYLQRVSKKSFLLLTFLAPVLFAAMVFVPLWLATLKSDEVKNIAVLDQVGKYASAFKNTDDSRLKEIWKNIGRVKIRKSKPSLLSQTIYLHIRKLQLCIPRNRFRWD